MLSFRRLGKLISIFVEIMPSCAHIGVKQMGEIEPKTFEEQCRPLSFTHFCKKGYWMHSSLSRLVMRISRR